MSINSHTHSHGLTVNTHAKPTRSVLAWPAWLRVAAIMPIVLALWLAVLWANEGASLW